MHSEQEILFRHCRLDPVNQLLWRGSRVIPLRQKSFAVLQYLVERSGQLATKEELLRAVWPETYVSDTVLKVCIRELRHALGDQKGEPQFIETVHRRGYRFIAPVASSQYPVASKQPGGDISHQLTTGNWQLATRLVGREAELAQIHWWLEKARTGERQIVFVTGEPGIGKTTLVETFLARVSGDPTIWVARGQCIEQYGAGEAYLPVLEALNRLCRGPGRERLMVLFRQFAPMWLFQIPSLVAPGERKKLLREIPGTSREYMLREIGEVIEALTGGETAREGRRGVPLNAPTNPPLLVLVLEDLHWSDYSTVDFISYLARRQEPARLLLVGTYRPTAMDSHSHLRAVKQELQMHRLCQELPLRFLTAENVAEYLATHFAVGAPRAAPLQRLARVIYQRTDGNPLFMVNVVDDLVAQGVLARGQPEGELHPVASLIEENHIRIPDNIQQMIEQQIERLKPEEQRGLEVASVAGTEFSVAAVAVGLGGEVGEVEECCEGLARRGHFLRARGVSEWPDGTVTARYEFIHSLYQQVWYERVTAGRRVQLHRRIGERGELAYGSKASEIAAELALHFERGRDYSRAVQYRHQAARNALHLCAYYEAITHLTKGLELLKALSDTPEHVHQEISLRIALGLSLITTKGHAVPEVEKNYTRALELCQRVEATPQLYWALWGLQGFYFIRAELQTARALGEQLFDLAQRLQDPGLLSFAHSVLGVTLFSLGELLPARTHLEQAIALCDAQKHARLRAICVAFAGRVLWALGYPDQALQMSREAVLLARELAHPLTSVITSCIAALLHIVRREVSAAQERAEEVLTLAKEQGFVHWEAQVIALQGWALAQQGHREEGVTQIRLGLAAYQNIGAQLARPLLLGLLAETYKDTAHVEEGLAVATEALALARHTGQRSQEVWLSWLKGELLLQQEGARGGKLETGPSSPPASSLKSHGSGVGEREAEECFQHALDLARRQGGKALELRAGMRLSRLWQQQGKKAKARQLLGEIYGWFTEGFDTVDLKEARALLKELGG